MFILEPLMIGSVGYLLS